MNKFIRDGIKEALTIEPMEDTAEIERRYAICKACPLYNAKKDQCTVCKCYMEQKTQLKYNRNPQKGFRIEETHCPMGYWGDKDIANLYRERDGLELLD